MQLPGAPRDKSGDRGVIVSILVAWDDNRAIGLENALPWRLSTDLKRFKQLTLGHHLVMGRKTFESIGQPLPGRRSIILTRNPAFKSEGCLVAASLGQAFAMAEERGEKEVFVIGGSQIYAQALPLADRIYLSRVHAKVNADTFFPEFDENEWEEQALEFHPADGKNQYPFTFKLLTRN